MLDCTQFVTAYSAFRDGDLDPAEQAEFDAHRATCPSCERYDRVVRRGSELFRELPELQPSEDFMPRLQHRIFHVEEEMRSAGPGASGVSAGVTLAIAVLFAISAWAPVIGSRSEPVRLPAMAAAAPEAGEQAAVPFRSGPLVEPAEAVDPDSGPLASNALFFRYSPIGGGTASPVQFISGDDR